MEAKLIAYITRHPGCNKSDAIFASSNARRRGAARSLLESLICDGLVQCDKDDSGKTHLYVVAAHPTAPDHDIAEAR